MRAILCTMLSILLAGVVVTLPSPAVAQDVQFKQRTVVEFDDDRMDGRTAKKPSTDIRARLLQPPERLIHIRADFRRQVLVSVYKLK